MQIQLIGAAGTVTASKHLVQTKRAPVRSATFWLALSVASCAGPLRGAAQPPLRLAPASAAASSPAGETKPLARAVYVGAYTAPGTAPGGHEPSRATGISVFRMDPRTGGLTRVQVVDAPNPSFLALDPARTHLYCANEEGIVDGRPAGRVGAYTIDRATGKLELLNTQPTGGAYPAHLSVHPSGRYLLASNYGRGDYPVYRIAPDGAIGPETDDAQGEGNGAGPRPDRQDGPHAHQILTDPAGRYVFGVDLGADQIHAWSFDLTSGKLSPAPVPRASAPSGAGPRHMAFHPGGAFAYVLEELGSAIAVYRYDAVRGALVWMQTLSTLPPDFDGPNQTAELRIHPSGRFAYATNRGHNSVAVFAIDPIRGRLESVGWEPTRGDWPRGMNIDPSGTFLYVANQNSDNIVIFRIDGTSGRLALTDAVVQTPTPSDIEFGPDVSIAAAAR